jgi:hypothetical protein
MLRIRLFAYRGQKVVWIAADACDLAALAELIEVHTDSTTLNAVASCDDPDDVRLVLASPQSAREGAFIWPCLGSTETARLLAELADGASVDRFFDLWPSSAKLLLERVEDEDPAAGPIC